MAETQRLLQAAAALSQLLTSGGIPHAFYGSVFTAVLAGSTHSDEIFCIVQYGQTQAHPFRRVRDAIAGNEDFAAVHSPWTNRLLVSYRRLIPAIEIEILPAGETGPRILGDSTVIRLHEVPFLTFSEFIRAKLKAWTIRGSDRDAQDITYVLSRYWNRVDINRIPEQDMETFATRNADVVPAWTALKRRFHCNNKTDGRSTSRPGSDSAAWKTLPRDALQSLLSISTAVNEPTIPEYSQGEVDRLEDSPSRAQRTQGPWLVGAFEGLSTTHLFVADRSDASHKTHDHLRLSESSSLAGTREVDHSLALSQFGNIAVVAANINWVPFVFIVFQ